MAVVDISRHEPSLGGITADRRLYADAAGKPVEADSSERNTLIAVVGGVISKADQAKYGLSLADNRVTYDGDKGAKKAKMAAGEPAPVKEPAPRASRK